MGVRSLAKVGVRCDDHISHWRVDACSVIDLADYGALRTAASRIPGFARRSGLLHRAGASAHEAALVAGRLTERDRHLREFANAAATLDIFDLAYELGTENFHWASTEPASYPRKGVTTRLASFVYRWILAVRDWLRRPTYTIPPSSVLFFAISQNERHSLEPVVAAVPEGRLVGSGRAAKNDFPFAAAYAQSLRYLPAVLRAMANATGFRRRSFAYNFDAYLRVFGLYVCARRWLRELHPLALVLGNHLNVVHRTLRQAAHDEGIPTVYLQHSTVPDCVPPLDFTYSLLEGRDVLEKYSAVGQSKTSAYLVGMPKFDAYAQYSVQSPTVKSVAICTNPLDPLGPVDHLCTRLGLDLPSIPVTLRPHPADRRMGQWRRFAKRHCLDFSEWSSEHPLELLRRVDVMIAGDSNIHLEAALMEVLPVYYDFSGAKQDWYGFYRNGLVEFAADDREVVKIIRREATRRTSVRSRAKRYCVTVGTPYDGASANLAGGLIRSLVGAAPDLEQRSVRWQLIPNVAFDAFEPK